MLNKKIRTILFEVADKYKTNIVYYCENQIKENLYYINGTEIQLIVRVLSDSVCFSIEDLRFNEVGVGLDDYPLVYERVTLFNKTAVENILHSMEYYIGCEDFKEFLEKLETILRETEDALNE